MITGRILGDRYRYRRDKVPAGLSKEQIEVRELFLKEIHEKFRYRVIDRCPYCGVSESSLVSEVDGRGLPAEIVVCNACGGSFKRTVFTRESAELHYNRVSYVMRGKSKSPEAMATLFAERVRAFGYPRFRFIKAMIGEAAGKGKVIEFGCGDGANLVPWREGGSAVVGVEIDETVSDFARTRGIEVVRQSPNAKFSLAIFAHYLEHADDADAALSAAYALLDEGGYLFIEVPGARVQTLGDTLRYFDAEHNYNFDQLALVRVVERNSFDIVYSDEYCRLLARRRSREDERSRMREDHRHGSVVSSILEPITRKIAGQHNELYDVFKRNAEPRLSTRIRAKIATMYFSSYYVSVA